MAPRNAKRKKRAPARTEGKVPGSGGRPRGRHEVEDITDQVANAMLYNQGRRAISRALGIYLKSRGWQQTDEPMPLSTVDEYIRRAEDMVREERALTRAEATAQQVRRLARKLLKADAEDRHRDAIAIESLLSKIQGTEAPKTFEVSAPGGGPIAIKTVPEAVAAFQRMVDKRAA